MVRDASCASYRATGDTSVVWAGVRVGARKKKARVGSLAFLRQKVSNRALQFVIHVSLCTGLFFS